MNKQETYGRGWWPPMLASVYVDGETQLEYPVYAQPKLDGVRALWDRKELWSRSGKKTLKFHPRVLKEVKCHFGGFPLDGELFLKNEGFESVVSKARTGGFCEYHVFDIPTGDSFQDRWKELTKLFFRIKNAHVMLVDTTLIRDKNQLNEHMEKMELMGYEGQIIRDRLCRYEYKRTKYLLKRKRVIEEEAAVVSVEPGKGKHEGRIGALVVHSVKHLWSCKVGTGLSDAEREREDWVGEVIIIGYQELSKYGVPRFPRFLRIKEDG